MRIVLCLAVLLAALFLFTCAPEDKSEDEAVDESVTFDLLVDVDEIFGYARDTDIGSVYFSDTHGLVGSRIRCVVTLSEIERFKDAVLAGKIELDNINAIKAEDYEVLFEVQDKQTEVEFYIPQILTIPTILNFVFTLSYEEDDGGEEPDLFETSQVFQFVITEGAPAT